MCGISCIITNKKLPPNTLELFNNKVRHRGPDSEGIAKFVKSDNFKQVPDSSNDFFIGLGHRRLSILDLSDAGKQPMISNSGQCVISYNGEIYNFEELKQELIKKGRNFSSTCDTEVLLQAYEEWGTKCFKKFNGMWALVILDRKKQSIIIARDRLGIKPLYFYSKSNITAFGSEIKQFSTLPEFTKQANKKACMAYLVNGYEIPPETFYQDISVFPPAHYAEIKLLNTDKLNITPIRYWNPNAIMRNYLPQKEVIENISKLFKESVKLRLRSDVPVGTCLSGGLDSSSIFILMSELAKNPNFSAFSACFDDPFADERRFMKEVIKKTPESSHIKVFPNDEEFTNDFDIFLAQHDEPVGSASIYAQYLVMKTAKENNVPVLLDGQGGDELFSGYWQSYFLLLDYYKKNSSFLGIFKHLTSAILPHGNQMLISEIFAGLKEFKKRSNLKFCYSLNKKLLESASDVLPSYNEIRSMDPYEYRVHELVNLRLPRLLKWEDRNSMAFSIESRVPFLDINLIEFMLSIDPKMNLKNGWTKYLFRKAMSNSLPKTITWRKDKKGFETPQNKWMKNGIFHDTLKQWSLEKNHPVEEFISTSFNNINSAIQFKTFDSNAIFRLYCLDKWLKR